MMPAEGSTYAAHPQSYRDEESVLGHMGLLNATPDKDLGGVKGTLTMKASNAKRTSPVDDYEDLLNTIEQEHSRENVSGAADGRNIQSSSQRTGSNMPSAMTMD